MRSLAIATFALGTLLVSGCGGPPVVIPMMQEDTVASEPGWEPPRTIRKLSLIHI